MTTQSKQPVRRGEAGQAIVIVAVALVVLLGFAALSIDYAYVTVSKDELRRAADAAALAAASQLVHDDLEAASEQAIHFAAANTIAQHQAIISPETDIEFGQMQHYPDQDPIFVPGAEPVDSVRVTVRCTDGSANGPLPTFFASLLGHSSVELSASAVASLPDKRVMLVLDRSGSMDDDTPGVPWWWYLYGGDPPDPQPITDMKYAAIGFIDRLDAGDDKIGLVSYSDDASLDHPLSFELQGVKDSIMELQANGWTNIGDGIQLGLQQLQADPCAYLNTRVIVLLSDGRANRPYSETYGRQHALDMAGQCAGSGVKVFTISLGDSADQELMQQIAHMTEGAHFYASSGAELPETFNTIFERMPARLSM